MQIVNQKKIQPLTPNEGILCSASMGKAVYVFEKSIEAGCPLIFLDTNDWGVVNQLLVTWQINHPDNPLNSITEYLYGYGDIGSSFFDAAAAGNEYVVYSEKSFSDNSTQKQVVKELYDLIFDVDTNQSKLILLRGFSKLIEDCSFVIDWLLKQAIHLYNSIDADQRRVFIIAEPYVTIPSLLIPCSTKIILPKPDAREIQNIFAEKFSNPGDDRNAQSKKRIYDRLNADPAKKRTVLNNLLGFSKTEIEYLFDYSASDTPKEFERTIKLAKTSLAAKAASLQLIDAKEDDFGGLENLREHMKNVAALLSRRDIFCDAQLPCPKGILLVGMPGCGKSLAAKASAKILNRPLLQLDFGKILGKFVGESELNFRTALDIAEKSSPCVLWIDELEKAFAGLEDSTGVTKRLFGHFLTWMQDTTADVYIVATANNISKIPPEFKRKGRFDKIFSIHMPNKEERKKIFEFHLHKLARKDMLSDGVINQCAMYAEETSYRKMSADSKDDKGVSGADIAAMIQSSLGKAIRRGNNEGSKGIRISSEDIIDAIREVKGHTQRDIMKNQIIEGMQTADTDGYLYLEKFLNESGYISASKE